MREKGIFFRSMISLKSKTYSLQFMENLTFYIVKENCFFSYSVVCVENPCLSWLKSQECATYINQYRCMRHFSCEKCTFRRRKTISNFKNKKPNDNKNKRKWSELFTMDKRWEREETCWEIIIIPKIVY